MNVDDDGALRKLVPGHSSMGCVVACFALGLGVLNFFLILLAWNLSGVPLKVDSIAVSISILQIFLAVGALGGFFLLRSAAVSAAEMEARSEFSRFKKKIRKDAERVARRSALEYLETTGLRNGAGTSAAGTPDVMGALDQEEVSDEE